MSLIKSIITKFRPPEYRLDGKCLQCGTCCKLIYTLDDYTTTDFKITQFIFPKYKRFEIVGKDEQGFIMLRCKWITEDNKCSQYKKRLDMCKNFPNVKYGSLGKLPKGCGFKLAPIKNFDDVLEKQKKFKLPGISYFENDLIK